MSAQKSEESFSSQQRPHETGEASTEPEAEQERPEPVTFKEKVMDKLRGMSIMPSPDQALPTTQEDTGPWLLVTVFHSFFHAPVAVNSARGTILVAVTCGPGALICASLRV